MNGDFDVDKNYIIQKPTNLSDLFSVFHQLSSSLQAEILGIFIGIMRKSERNRLACLDGNIYGEVLKTLSHVDDDVVADLLVDILMVLTSLTIDVNELKCLLRYLKSENRLWVNENIIIRIDCVTNVYLFFCIEKKCNQTIKYSKESSLSLRTR